MTFSKYLVFCIGFFYACLLQAQDACEFPSGNVIGEFCSTAQFMCGASLDGYIGRLDNKNNPDGQPDPLCNNEGTAENMHWISFIPCDAEVEIDIIPSNCSNPDFPGSLGIQAGVYEDCDFESAIACESNIILATINLELKDLTPGKVYYMYIDGWSASVCDFEIDVISGINTDPVSIDSQGEMAIKGEDDICTDGIKPYQYTIDGECLLEIGASNCSTGFVDSLADNWFCYQWNISPATGWIIIGDQHAKELDIIWDPGIYTISAEIVLNPSLGGAGEGCYTGETCLISSLEVVVEEPAVVKVEEFICEGDTINFCGMDLAEPGIYDCVDTTNCVLNVLEIKMKTDSITDLGTFFVCPNECVEIEDKTFCEEGTFEYVSDNGCNIIYNFVIKSMSITVDVDGLEDINCGNDVVELTANVVTDYQGLIKYEWYKNSVLDGTGLNYNTSDPGNYFIKAYADGFDEDCFDEYMFTISEDYEAPEVELNCIDLDCVIDEVRIEMKSLDALASFVWTGKNNFTSDEMEPMIQDSGMYYVEITGLNGCKTNDSIFVNANYPKANINVDFNNLSCEVAQTILSYISDIEIDSVVWIGPEAKKYFENNPTIEIPGKYELKLYSTEGCDYSYLFQVLGNFESPSYQFGSIEDWGCKTNAIDIGFDNIGDPNYEVTWSTENGKIDGNPNQQNIEVSSIGTYHVLLVNPINGCEVVDSVTINPNGNIPEQLNIELIDPLCYGIEDGLIEILEVVGGEEPYTTTINGDLIQSNTIPNLAGGSYKFLVTDANGCTLTKKVQINTPTEIEGQLDGPSTARYLEEIAFQAIVDWDLYNISQINWYNQAGEYIASGDFADLVMLNDEIITMEVIDENGCIAIRTAPIKLDTDFKFYTPNIFSPNGDGNNDLFYISSEELPETTYELQVFDRWGNQMYDNDQMKLNDPTIGWDGKFRNSTISSGVYSYVAQIEVLGVKKKLVGSITIVK